MKFDTNEIDPKACKFCARVGDPERIGLLTFSDDSVIYLTSTQLAEFEKWLYGPH